MWMHRAKPSLKKLVFRAAWPFFFALKKVGKSLYSLGLNYEFQKDWGSFPNPEQFNHEMSLAFFPSWRLPHFFERGVYVQELLKPDYQVLDLCCGDGSVTALFIAPKVAGVVGVDFDEKAVKMARSKYSRFSNVSFRQGDIRGLEFPAGQFDLVTWDGAIEHFTQEEMDKIFGSIRRVLKGGGTLAGSTVAKQEFVQHHDHEFEFETLAELKTFLGRYFRNTYVWERKHSDRLSFYFRCSDEPKPLESRFPE
jgi:ubiquinone/menaquinone biosynthesis C-methylase UbiE